MKPGAGPGALRTAPPGPGCSSKTTTSQPASASTLAATSPLGPAPTTTATTTRPDIPGQLCWETAGYSPFHRTRDGYLPAMSTSTTPTDVITFLIEQHNEVNDMFAQLEQMDGATDDKVQRLAEQVVTWLVKHSVAEETYLYPTVRKVLP